MNKKMLVLGIALIMLCMAAAIVFAGQINGVEWSWSGGDVITARSTDKIAHVLYLAVTVTNRGYTSCVNADISVPASGRATWDVKQKIGSGATIDGVSVTDCK